MMKDDIGLQLGNVMVATTQNKGHDPEFWAEQVTNKIVGISETAAPHIRQQAEAFRSQVYQVILLGDEKLNKIRPSDPITNKLRQQGHEAMANIIKEL
jgi:hypothetical protein